MSRHDDGFTLAGPPRRDFGERHRPAGWCKPLDPDEAIALPTLPKPPLLEGGTESDWINSLD